MEKAASPLSGLARWMRSERRSVALLTGAGVSVGAGIPDFRSPGGMYDTLRPELLTATEAQRRAMAAEPTAVVSWELFRSTPLPYLELRRPFIKGLADAVWKPTVSHMFVRLLHDKGYLRRLYTQNIDGLDFATGVPREKVVPVHGTMGTASCEFCDAQVDIKLFTERVSAQVKDIYGVDPDAPLESTAPLCESCGRPGVKPDTVLYGRSLPAAFFECSDEDLDGSLDLLIVAGTSLTVSPANSVVPRALSSTRRLVVNMEPVGLDLGIQPGSERDLCVWGRPADDVFLDLCEELGWLDDLAGLRDGLAPQSAELLDARLKARQGQV